MIKDTWNRCDECGQFIALEDFADGKARHIMLEPDSELGNELWETLCMKHMQKVKPQWKEPRYHCQNGSGDICLAGNRDGIACPHDSCDIDDAVRPDPRTTNPNEQCPHGRSGACPECVADWQDKQVLQ